MVQQLTVQQALHVLQLQPGATTDEIRSAYKRLALKYHPDKQQQRAPNNRSSSVSADAAAAFSLLSAAHELLTNNTNTSNSNSSSSSSSTWPSFEAAYASGSLFSEQLLDQAVLSGLPPADVAHLQHLCEAAAAGRLAAQLAQQPPSPSQEDEHLWRQLYAQLTLNWQLQQLHQQQQQQQQQAGVGLGDLLSDLLLKPTGQVMVELSDEEEEGEEKAAASAAGRQDQAAAAAEQQCAQQGAAASAGASQKQQRRRQWRPVCLTEQVARQRRVDPRISQHGAAGAGNSKAQQLQPSTVTSTQHDGQQQQGPQAAAEHSSSSSSNNSKKRQRHGFGFYFMWLRRLLLAKAVLSVLTSRPRPEHDSSLFDVL